MNEQGHDSIIVGAGPAGLTAALYLARFRRDTLVVHDGKSRALRIPRTHNAPGFPDGVKGVELIERMSRHAESCGARIERCGVIRAERADGLYVLTCADGRVLKGRSLILATGLHLNQVSLPDDVHEQAIRDGILRYCPICDGYEHTNARIGVIGANVTGAAEALFLRQFSKSLVLMPHRFAELTERQKEQLREADIEVVETPISHYEPHENEMRVWLQGVEEPLRFGVIYPALGCRQRTELAGQLGLPLHEDGAVELRAPYGTQLPGLYCCGDIVEGLDQISVAVGHGAIAATKVHNWLREQDAHILRDRSSPTA